MSFLLSWTFAPCCHLCNGIRNLVRHLDFRFELHNTWLRKTYLSGRTVVVVSLILTPVNRVPVLMVGQ